jgi:adenine-specific DNA-methyltransferase
MCPDTSILPSVDEIPPPPFFELHRFIIKIKPPIFGWTIINIMTKTKKGKYGQFNTSSNECEFTINEIKKHFKLVGSVLEPSFGSGNFVVELKKHGVEIDCFEIDKDVFSPIEGTNSILGDFLLAEFNKKYDFIVGNPPYIELVYSFYDDQHIEILKSKYSIKNRGRVNLIHFFMDKSFELLKDNGVIAYLLPSTILSSPWYNDIREKIYNEYSVVDIINNIPFKEVSIDVCLLILQKKVDVNHSYITLKNGLYTLTKNISSGITLKEKGFKCQIGDKLWYKYKDVLSDDPINKVLLYSNNIKNGQIEIGNVLKSKIPGKKQYIITESPISIKNCIVIPRVISKKMRFALIKDNETFLFENHVMVITHDNINMLDELYNKLLSNEISFEDYFNSSNITVNEVLNFEY